MPFTSDLLGKYSANPLAVDIFAVNLLGATLATALTLVYGRRQDLTMETSAKGERTLQAVREREGLKRQAKAGSRPAKAGRAAGIYGFRPMRQAGPYGEYR